VSDDTYNLALKVPMAVIDRLDALVPDVAAEYQHLQAAGLIRKVSRSTVGRLAMDAGLAALEAKYRDKPAQAKPKASKPAPKASRETPDADPYDPESTYQRAYPNPSRRSPTTTEVGRLLREWRERQPMTQAQAADAIGIQQASVSRLERGVAKRAPTAKTREAIEAVTGIPASAWTEED
jgi:DNA-binding XRE family transcriptional regulator